MCTLSCHHHQTGNMNHCHKTMEWQHALFCYVFMCNAIIYEYSNTLNFTKYKILGKYVMWCHFSFQSLIKILRVSIWTVLINPTMHQSHPTRPHFVAEICTCVHISLMEWCIVGYLHYGICETNLLCFVRCCVIPMSWLLTHCGLVTPYGDIDLGRHWLR